MKKSQVSKVGVQSSRASYQDVLDAPPHKVAEIVDGKLYIQPRPAMRYAKVSSGLGGIINPSFQFGRGGPGGWWIINEPELHLNHDIVVPDIAGWCLERMPNFPTGAYCTIVPDWVCEVLSPSTRKLDLGGKKEIYRREQVGYLWFIDPIARLLEAFEVRVSEWVLIDRLFDDATVSLPPFDAISFNLGDLWPPPHTHTVHKEAPGKVPVVLESE